MNNRSNAVNVGKGDLKTSPAAKGVKTEIASLVGKQLDSVQRDKGSRFSSARAGDSGAQESQAKNPESEKNIKFDRAPADDTDSSAADTPAETQSVPKEKKFSGRCRLFVGNLPNDMTETEFQKFFEPHGELNEVFLNASRGFGFIRLVSMFCLELHQISAAFSPNRPLRGFTFFKP